MASKSRLVFIDLLCGWAVIVMVEVHVFNAFMITSFRTTGWFEILNYVNGLVAPSFIFISGFVFMVASQRKLESFRMYGSDFWRQLWRISLVWIVGYYLHVPFFSLRRMIYETTDNGWLQFFQSDVLHCIACGLLFLFILRLLIQSNRVYKYTLLCLGLLVTASAPIVWTIDFTRYVPGFFAAYFNGLHYSLFPLFPWLSFMFFAGYFAVGYLEAREKQHEQSYINRFAIIGLCFVILGILMRILPIETSLKSLNPHASPFFFFERLGVVMLLLTACWYYAERRKTEQSVVLDVSRQSLMAYAGHLIVIYGRYVHNHSLAYYYGNTFTPLECMVGTLVLLFLVLILSVLWDWLKRDHIPLARILFSVFALTTSIGFIFT